MPKENKMNDKTDWNEIRFKDWVRVNKVLKHPRYSQMIDRANKEYVAGNLPLPLAQRMEKMEKGLFKIYMQDRRIRKEYKAFLAIKKMVGDENLPYFKTESSVSIIEKEWSNMNSTSEFWVHAIEEVTKQPVMMDTQDCILRKLENKNCKGCNYELNCCKLIHIIMLTHQALTYKPENFFEHIKVQSTVSDMIDVIMEAKTIEEVEKVTRGEME